MTDRQLTIAIYLISLGIAVPALILAAHLFF